MSFGVAVGIVVAVSLLIALALLVSSHRQQRALDARRQEAVDLLQEADERSARNKK